MAHYTPFRWVDGETVLSADRLNGIERGVAVAGGGLSVAEVQALQVALATRDRAIAEAVTADPTSVVTFDATAGDNADLVLVVVVDGGREVHFPTATDGNGVVTVENVAAWPDELGATPVLDDTGTELLFPGVAVVACWLAGGEYHESTPPRAFHIGAYPVGAHGVKALPKPFVGYAKRFSDAVVALDHYHAVR